MENPDLLIVFLGPMPSDEAPANHAKRICRGLQLNGWKPLMLCAAACRGSSGGSTSGFEGEWQIGYECVSFPVPRLPFNMLYYTHRAARELEPKRYLEGNTVKAVLFYGSSKLGFSSLFNVCHDAGVPILTYEVEYPVLHNLPRLLTGAYWDHRMYLTNLLQRASGIIGISSFWKQIADRHGIPSVTIPSYLPVEAKDLVLQRTKKSGVRNPNRLHIVTLGRWASRECPLVILRAVRKASLLGVPISYTAIGASAGRLGYHDSHALRLIRKDPVLRDVVRTTLRVSEAEKAEILESADAFVILRRQNVETAALFPTRLPEYLSYQRPLIVSSAGDLGRYLRHKDSAWLVPPDDNGDLLAEAFYQLHHDRKLAEKIGHRGAEQAMSNFSIESNGQIMTSFIESVTSRESAHAMACL